jgi:hypothetical protein
MSELNQSGKWTYNFVDGERSAVLCHMSTREREEYALRLIKLAQTWSRTYSDSSIANLETLHDGIMLFVNGRPGFKGIIATTNIDKRNEIVLMFKQMIERVDGEADMGLFCMQFFKEEGLIQDTIDDGEILPTAKEVDELPPRELEKLGEVLPGNG